MAGEEGDGRVQESQMAVAGSGGGSRRVAGGLEFKIGAAKARLGQQGPDGGSALGQDGGGGALGWDTRQGLRFQPGVGFQTKDGVPDKGWGSRQGWGSSYVM